MRDKGLKVSIIVLVLLAASFVIVPGGARGVLTGIELVEGKYAGTVEYDGATVNVYVPGETIDVIVYGNESDMFNIFIGVGAGTLYQNLVKVSGVVINADGNAKIQYSIPNALPDGFYRIDVLDHTVPTFVESLVMPDGHAVFKVQKYGFVIETDRPAYLGGDLVNIFWTANNIKDESLAPDGVGRIIVLNGTGLKISDFTFAKAAGSYTYQLNQFADSRGEYTVVGWFNSSAINPERSLMDVRNFDVSELALIITLDSEVYAPGSLVVVDVKTLATETIENPSLLDPAEPGCTVGMSVSQMSGGSWVAIPSYDTAMTSDSNGYARTIFQLPLGLSDGQEFRLLVNATKGSRTQTKMEFFSISATAGLSIVISLDKTQYTSGDTVRIGATVSTIGSAGGTSYTYVFEVRGSNSEGILLARATMSSPAFNFSIGNDFEGALWISVTVDDGKGNKATVFKLLDVKFAVVMVNADEDKYSSGDTIHVSYSVYGAMMTAPAMFYEVIDADGASVSEGNATGGSFSFAVPSAPSSSYTFRVIASQGGRLVFGQDVVEQIAGYVIIMDFNREAYAPGDTIYVEYSIVSLGGTPMPGTFSITYGLSNGPTMSTHTADVVGTLSYVVPETIDEGDQVFWMYTEGGVTSTEVITVSENTNPLWYTSILGLPLSEILLFLLVLLCLALIARSSRRAKRGPSVEPDEEYAPPKQRQSKPRRQPSSSPAYSVPCNSCGSGIEISTSKRPIEVMCPSCGETQIVEK